MGYLEMKYRGEIQFPPFQAKQLNYSLIRLYARISAGILFLIMAMAT